MNNKKVLVLDIGTRDLKALLFDDKGELIRKTINELKLIQPAPSFVEQDPIEIYQILLKTIKSTINDERVDGIAITNNRSTTIVWDRSGKPLYNAITWMDSRGYDVANRLKSELNLPEEFARLLLYPHASSMYLRWILDNVTDVKPKAEKGEIFFGTLNTYIIWMLTNGGIHAIDPSNASATGLFDPFSISWWTDIIETFKIPHSILPEVKENISDYGEVKSGPQNLIGVPILVSTADQQAALFGEACIMRGEVKVTNGSGSFVDMNVGDSIKFSEHGLIPMIAWKIKNSTSYLLEGYIAFSGELLIWLQEIGLLEEIEKIDAIAKLVNDSEGVYFVPAFTGLSAPYNDPTARGVLIGLSRGTKKEHIIRSALEGIAYSIYDIIDVMQKDTETQIQIIRADGNLSKSDFLLQYVANLTRINVERPKNLETTGSGAAYMALIGLDVISLNDIKRLIKIERVFEPKEFIDIEKLNLWKKAVEKARGWYK
ncbi:MAG: FGGY family carbohydrate kinase [Thermoprotei archaeon]